MPSFVPIHSSIKNISSNTTQQQPSNSKCLIDEYESSFALPGWLNFGPWSRLPLLSQPPRSEMLCLQPLLVCPRDWDFRLAGGQQYQAPFASLCTVNFHEHDDLSLKSHSIYHCRDCAKLLAHFVVKQHIDIYRVFTYILLKNMLERWIFYLPCVETPIFCLQPHLRRINFNSNSFN